MLGRLRGNRHDAKPTAVSVAAEAVRQRGDGAAETGAAVGGEDPQPVVSKPLTIEEKAALLTDSLVEIVDGITMPFSRQELVRIKRRFASMLLTDSLSAARTTACTAMPELSTSPFVPLLMRMISSPAPASSQAAKSPRKSPRKRNPAAECLTFDQFLTSLSILSVKQRTAVKRQALFKIYDADRDGRVSADDLVTTLSAITSSLSRSELRAAAVTQVPSWANGSETGLDYEAFQRLFSDTDVHAALTVAF